MSKDNLPPKPNSKIKDSLQKNISPSMKYSDGDHQILPYTKGVADKSKIHLQRVRQKTKCKDESNTTS